MKSCKIYDHRNSRTVQIGPTLRGKPIKTIKVDSYMANLVKFINHKTFCQTILCCAGHNHYAPTLIYEDYTRSGPRRFELFSGMELPIKTKYYKTDKQGYYYIPELNPKLDAESSERVRSYLTRIITSALYGSLMRYLKEIIGLDRWEIASVINSNSTSEISSANRIAEKRILNHMKRMMRSK